MVSPDCRCAATSDRSDLVQKALQFIAIEETQAGLLKAHDVPATRC
jgi:hypothetical protein